MEKFGKLVKDNISWKVANILPKVLNAGDMAGTLSVKVLDYFLPAIYSKVSSMPRGRTGTGMTATNSIRVRTGNVSAGTSIFAMVVLEELSRVYLKLYGLQHQVVACSNGTLQQLYV